MKTDGYEKLEKLYGRFLGRYGEDSAKEIFEIIIQELGPDRITISLAYYDRKIRNQQIKKNFHGGNYTELAERYGCTAQHIRRIVHSEENGKS